ncbi:MAG: FtsX-like permease family protein, partial [Bacteroidota bacterium]
QPLDQVYLTSDFVFDIGRSGSLETVYLFSAIAIFILGLACINFMNLSTARSANRAKEVGVRKALGSLKTHLVRQFLVESVLLSVVAYALGIFLVLLIMPFFNQLSGKELTLPLSEPVFVFILAIAALVTGVLAGLYPAFFLSSFKPINTLKGKLALGSGNSRVRSGLVVFQFFVSILLIIGTIAVDKQLKYIQNKKIGFNKEQVLLVNDAYMLGDSRDAFKEEVVQLGSVVSASFSGFIPVNGYNRNDNTYWKKGLTPDESNTVNSQMWSVDYDYVKTMGMEIIEGRDFDKGIASDSGAVLLNEEAMRKFGFDQIDGNTIQTYGFDGNTGTVLTDQFDVYKIIGVVKDFHFESLKEDIAPLALRLGRSTGVMSVRLSTNDFANSIDLIEEKWKKFGTGLPFNYNFLDDQFANMYRAESRLAKIFGIFAGLAILIGCLGLFALATFMAEQRTKEIGIRKVLGASVSGIVLMLSKDFSKLVIIAFLIAVPVAWWGISSWLANYNYRIGVGLELFIISGVIAFVIAWLTVGYQSVKAAARNPVKSLRSE